MLILRTFLVETYHADPSWISAEICSVLPTQKATAVLAAGPDSYSLCSVRQQWYGRDGRKCIWTPPCGFNNIVFLLTSLKMKLHQEQRHQILLAFLPTLFSCHLPRGGKLPGVVVPSDCCSLHTEAFRKKDMFRAFSFWFTLDIMLLSMSSSIMSWSVMQGDKCSKVFTV